MPQAKKSGRPLSKFNQALAEANPAYLASIQASPRMVNVDILGNRESHARLRADHLALARQTKAMSSQQSDLSRARERRLQVISAELANPIRRLGKLSNLAVANYLTKSLNGVSKSTLRKDIAYLRKVGTSSP